MNVIFDDRESFQFQGYAPNAGSPEPKDSSLAKLVKRLTGVQDDKQLNQIYLIISGICILIAIIVYIVLVPGPAGNNRLPVIYREDVTPELEHLFTPEQLIDLPRKY